MSNLNSQAAAIWQEYLHAVRLAMSSLERGEQDELLEELEHHLAAEIEGAEQAVSEAQVQSIIECLGPPETLAEVHNGDPGSDLKPEPLDLILVYGSLLLFGIGLAIPASLVLTLPIAVVLARISLQKQCIRTSPTRWAAYPALLATYVLLVAVVLYWALIPALPIAATGGFLPQWLAENPSTLEPGSTRYWLIVWSVCFFLAGIWWLLLARILKGRIANLSTLFFPFSFYSPRSISLFLITGGLLHSVVASLVLMSQL